MLGERQPRQSCHLPRRYPSFCICVPAIIFDPQQLVLLCHRRDYDLWNLPGGAPTVSDEADRVEFFAAESVPPNTLPKQVERIRDALSQPNQVVMKVQRGRPSIETNG